MKQISNFSVRYGAGRKALFNYLFFAFLPVTLLWVLGLFVISFLTDISPSQNPFFIGFTIIGLPAIMVLIPISFVFGFFSKRLQKKWLIENIDSNQYLIKFYQERLDNLDNQKNEAIAQEIERLEEIKRNQEEENRRQKDKIVSVTKESLGDLEKAHKKIFENPQIVEVDIFEKISRQSLLDEAKESLENICLDAFDILRDGEEKIVMSHEKLTQTITDIYEKAYLKEREILRNHIKDISEKQLAYQEKLKNS